MIQFNFGVSAYNVAYYAARAALPAAAGGGPGAALAAGGAGGEAVSLSAAGQALVVSERPATQGLTPAQEKLLQAAGSDSASAEKIAQDMAEAPSTIFYNLNGVGGGEPVNRLASSGRVIDEAFKQRFGQEAASIDAQRRAIYDTEKAKGTDPVEIVRKMIDFTNTQSRDYLEASGWGYQGSVPPA